MQLSEHIKCVIPTDFPLMSIGHLKGMYRRDTHQWPMTLWPVQIESAFDMKRPYRQKREVMAPIECITSPPSDARQVKGNAQRYWTSRDPPRVRAVVDSTCLDSYSRRVGDQRIGGMYFQSKEERIRR